MSGSWSPGSGANSAADGGGANSAASGGGANSAAALRNERIDDSGAALEPIYWVMLFVGAFLTILHLGQISLSTKNFEAALATMTTMGH